jgi:uncharacterized protein
VKQAVLIFAKNLQYGQVKTRLAATVGDDVAFSIYKHLLQHTVRITLDLPVDKIVFYSSHVATLDDWPDNIYRKEVQSGDDLGARMHKAFADCFDRGYEYLVMIGTDCLELNSDIIMDAFEAIKNNDVVIGPAKDGGYYLIALNAMHAAYFENISWSTDKVLEETFEICNRLRHRYFLLPALSDIDTEADYKEAEQQLLIKDL